MLDYYLGENSLFNTIVLLTKYVILLFEFIVNYKIVFKVHFSSSDNF